MLALCLFWVTLSVKAKLFGLDPGVGMLTMGICPTASLNSGVFSEDLCGFWSELKYQVSVYITEYP